MEESSEENNAASAVFNNQILVESILEHVTNDIRDNMSFRLVNRTFRNSCHAMLRKNHRKVKIEFVSEYYEEALRGYNEIHIYVNYRPVKVSNADNYFHLVKNIANVKVDSIYVKNLFLLTEVKQNTLHDCITRTLIGNDREIIKTLIGMEEICYFGCENCTQIPRKCLEYGPIRIKNLRESFAEPHFFEKLIITDYFLDNIANVCVKSSTTKEECMDAVENLINSNITCKTLVLKIPESWKKDMNDISLLDKLKPMPREVLEIILKKWRVQSLVLKLVECSPRLKQAGKWISKNWFSNLCLNDDHGNVKRSSPDFKISNVCIDLKDSYKSAQSFQYRERSPRFWHVHGHTLVSNVRRVFRCDKISFECSHWKQRLIFSIAVAVQRFTDLISMEDQNNLEVNIRIFPTQRNSKDVFNGFIEKKGSNPDFYKGFRILTLPSPLPVFLRSLEPIGEYPYFKLEKKEWIGDAFRMINKKKKLVINWEFMIEKEEPRMMKSGFFTRTK
ncbi:unnamed protein product [Caenorhabditis brenneri]